MIARVQFVRDLRHEDADKLPRLAFWTPGTEIAEAIRATASYVGNAATLKMKWKDGTRATMSVFLKKVSFGGDREGIFEVDVEAAKPFHAEVGEEVEISFEGGRHEKASDKA